MMNCTSSARTSQEVCDSTDREEILLRMGTILRKLNELTGQDEAEALMEALGTLTNRLSNLQENFTIRILG